MGILNTRKSLYRLSIIVIIIGVIFSFLKPAPTVSAIASNATIKPKVIVTLTNKQIIPSDNGKVALVTLKIDNQSSSELELIDYWARINGKSTKYVTKLVEEDGQKEIVLPGNQQYITYYANVSRGEELVDINVDIIEWNFSHANYESVLGNLRISEVNQPKVDETVSIRYGELNIESTLQNQFLYEDAQYKVVSYRIKLSNLINKSADISTLISYAIINNNELFEAITTSLSKAIDSKGDVYLYGQVNIPKETIIDAMSIALVNKKQEAIYPLVVFPVDKIVEESSKKLIDENIVHVGESEFLIKGKGVDLSAESKRSKISIPISITNLSSKQAVLENITFQLKTKSGFLYPLSIEETDIKNLLPEIEESLTISGFIPNEQAVVDSQLLVGLNIDSKNVSVKTLLLEDIKVDKSTSTDDFVVSGQKIALQRLSRMPNGEFDILVAEFQVTNNSDEAKKPLELTGQFQLDGVKIDPKETKVIRMNNSFTIQPKETEVVVLYISVPFTQVTKEYSMELTVNGSTKKELAMFLNGPNKILANNEKYTLKTTGKRGEVTYYDSAIYSGTSDDLFVVQLQVKNTEKRNVTPSMLNGYIQTNTGEVYQLAFEKYEQSMMPNGSKLLTASTPIPRGLNTKDLSIHFGEQLNSEQTIYIDPVYVMHTKTPTTKAYLLDMVALNDKKFWIWSINKTWILSGTQKQGLSIEFDYQIDEMVGGIGQLGDRQLMVEYQDLSVSAMRATKLFSLNNGTDLQVGRGKFELSYSNPTIDFENLPNGYNINVYEVYKGYKRLLMSQQFAH